MPHRCLVGALGPDSDRRLSERYAQVTEEDMTGIAIGLVNVIEGSRSPNRWWYRAIVVRHARDQRLRLVDVLELDDDGHRNAQELLRLAALAAQSDATV